MCVYIHHNIYFNYILDIYLMPQIYYLYSKIISRAFILFQSRKWQPTPVFLQNNPMDPGRL